MGNGFSGTSKESKSNKFDNFYEVMDYIATHYILTMDFESMSKLAEPEYCDKLVIITSDIIKNHFNDLNIDYLAQRVKNGEEVNDMAKEHVTFVSKEGLEGLDIKNDVNKSIKKKRVCIGIAKFYIKIAHIFAAILTTINPIYMYKDAEGNKIEKGLLEKGDIPKNVSREVSKTNICDNRIKRLTPLQRIGKKTNDVNDDINNENIKTDVNNQNNKPNEEEINKSNENNGTDVYNQNNQPNEEEINKSNENNGTDVYNQNNQPNEQINKTNENNENNENNGTTIKGGYNLFKGEEDKNIYVNPKVCELNLDSSGKPMMLSDEPGMSELIMLYMDDEYDYSNGTFKGMSDNMKNQFKSDLKTFYRAFTGNNDMPDTITKFSDIKLRTYDKTNGCQMQTQQSDNKQQPSNMLKNGTMVSLNDELFEKYAENLKNMIYNAQINQQRLLSIINELFAFVPEPYGDEKHIRVNPKLTNASLDSLVTKTRNIIIELYVTCEKDFAKGIDIYEAIVERNILRTSESQIKNLLKKQSEILSKTSTVAVNSIGEPSLKSEPMNQEESNQEPMDKDSSNQKESNQEPMNKEPLNNSSMNQNNEQELMNQSSQQQSIEKSPQSIELQPQQLIDQNKVQQQSIKKSPQSMELQPQQLIDQNQNKEQQQLQQKQSPMDQNVVFSEKQLSQKQIIQPVLQSSMQQQQLQQNPAMQQTMLNATTTVTTKTNNTTTKSATTNE